MNRVFFSVIVVSLLIGLTACKGDTQNVIKGIDTSQFTQVISDDFKMKNPAWKPYAGKWLFEGGELKQSAENMSYPVILREDKQFSDLDISVVFKPLTGDIDASGGLIFRAKDEGNYYIVRANALENNFRLYTFVDGYRRQLASASVTAPSLNMPHEMRVVVKGNHIQAYLKGKLELDYHDDTFKKGFTGLWTKEDSVTSFDDFKVSTVKVSQ